MLPSSLVLLARAPEPMLDPRYVTSLPIHSVLIHGGRGMLVRQGDKSSNMDMNTDTGRRIRIQEAVDYTRT